MRFTSSIKKNYEFRRLYAKGRSAATPYLACYARSRTQDTNSLGITVSTRLGHAVVRNRIRRRLREIYRLHEGEIRRGTQLVIVARQRAVNASYRQLEAAFLQCCGKLSLRTDEGEKQP